MVVPHKAKTIKRNGQTLVKVWINEQQRLFRRPFDPYMYSTTQRNDIRVRTLEEKVRKKNFINFEWMDLYKYSFKDVKMVGYYRDENSLECGTVFLQRILIDEPDFFKNPLMGAKPFKSLTFDIETTTPKDLFPKPERNPIKAISFAIDGGEPETKVGDGITDFNLLRWFKRRWTDEDPDIISGFNIKFFDLPYIFKRMSINRIPYDDLGRGRGYINPQHIDFVGRVIFDVFDEVRLDQTLSNLPDRKLKTMMKHIGIKEPVEMDWLRAEDVSDEEWKVYVESDVHGTNMLRAAYYRNLAMLSEMLGMPFSLLSGRMPGLLPRVFSARGLKQKDLVSIISNCQRFPVRFPDYQHDEEEDHTRFKAHKGRTRAAFQAATVAMYLKGLHKKVKKVDYKSLYPFTMVTLNISPETVNLIKETPVPKGTCKGKCTEVERRGDYIYMKIYDNPRVKKKKMPSQECIVELMIDQSEEGFYKARILEILAERASIKKQLKITYDEMLYSRQWSLKVLPNSFFGYNGSPHCEYGKLEVAMAIVAFGRYVVQFTVDWVTEHYGQIIIEIDTDGFYLTKEIDVDALNKAIKEHIEEKLGVKNYLEFELEEFGTSYFVKMKNYVLLDEEKDEVVIHGNSLKGTHVSRVYDAIVKEVANGLLRGKSRADVLAHFRDLASMRSYDLGMFVMSRAVRKNPRKYPDGNMLKKLVARYKSKFGIDLKIGDRIFYVKAHEGYRLLSEVERKDIDDKYYRKSVQAISEKFELTGRQSGLMEFAQKPIDEEDDDDIDDEDVMTY